jgi:uncharacterized membrane protein HdeD (DUF308 family)
MAIGTMMEHLSRNWGWMVLRGVIAILFGVLAIAKPGITLTALVLVWGAYALADGLLALVAGIKISDGGKPMWPLIVVGLIGIGAGIATFMRPQMTALVLLAFIAAWALTTGFFQVFAAVRLRKMISNEWLLGLSGLLSIVFGVFMLARPGAGALAVIWTIGWYAILFGAALVVLGFRIKGLGASVLKPA